MNNWGETHFKIWLKYAHIIVLVIIGPTRFGYKAKTTDPYNSRIIFRTQGTAKLVYSGGGGTELIIPNNKTSSIELVLEKVKIYINIEKQINQIKEKKFK